MTDERLAELERLCAAATPGPWAWGPHNSDEEYPPNLQGYPTEPDIRDGGGKDVPVFAWPEVMYAGEYEGEYFIDVELPDAAFIAAARAALPELLAEVRRLRAEQSERGQ